MWTDASVAVSDRSRLLAAIERARAVGVQQMCDRPYPPNPVRTSPAMFEAFSDSPCGHMSFKQCMGGWGLYHREPLVRHAVIAPLVACASLPHCIMPVKQTDVQKCPPRSAHPRHIGVCMRNDQSAITLVLAKLFREKFNLAAIETRAFQNVENTGRRKADYFAELERYTIQ